MPWLCLPAVALFSSELSPRRSKKITGCNSQTSNSNKGEPLLPASPQESHSCSQWSGKGAGRISLWLWEWGKHSFTRPRFPLQPWARKWGHLNLMDWRRGRENQGATAKKGHRHGKDTSRGLLLHKPCFQFCHLVKEANRSDTQSDHGSKCRWKSCSFTGSQGKHCKRPLRGRLWHDTIYLDGNRRLCPGFQYLISICPSAEKVQSYLHQAQK